jgi:hypothetical protein
MSFLEIASLYLKRIFPFVGLLEKVILDCNPKFTSKVFKEICNLLKIRQNMVSVYYLQIDRQSEKINQYVETALRIFGNF